MTGQGDRLLVGIISDTHNLVRPEAVSALRDCRRIIHAGDVCTPDVLEKLEALAPVTAVRGNNDKGDWAGQLPVSATFTWHGVPIHVIHDLNQIEIDPAADGVAVVVSGHSHQPRIEDKAGVLYINPGSAGPKRFKLPVSLAILGLENGKPEAWPVRLNP